MNIATMEKENKTGNCLETTINETELSIKPQNYENLGHEQQKYFQKLSKYQANFVKEKLFLEGKFTSEKEYEEAFTEFKKFAALAKLYDAPIAMTSEKVDEVWHQFILFTRDYMDFCKEFHGKYLHHSPNIPSRPEKKENKDDFATIYTKTFGEIPKIWNINYEVCKGSKCGSGCSGCRNSCVAPGGCKVAPACSSTKCSSVSCFVPLH